ncbi:hypothetical protein Tcan_00829, partial [Toxocara canis]
MLHVSCAKQGSAELYRERNAYGFVIKLEFRQFLHHKSSFYAAVSIVRLVVALKRLNRIVRNASKRRAMNAPDADACFEMNDFVHNSKSVTPLFNVSGQSFRRTTEQFRNKAIIGGNTQVELKEVEL